MSPSAARRRRWTSRSSVVSSGLAVRPAPASQRLLDHAVLGVADHDRARRRPGELLVERGLQAPLADDVAGRQPRRRTRSTCSAVAGPTAPSSARAKSWSAPAARCPAAVEAPGDRPAAPAATSSKSALRSVITGTNRPSAASRICCSRSARVDVDESGERACACRPRRGPGACRRRSRTTGRSAISARPWRSSIRPRAGAFAARAEACRGVERGMQRGAASSARASRPRRAGRRA